MLINEISQKVGMTKRAIKYYEDKHLITIEKNRNGYRNYTEEDVEILKKISVYRKLGIGIDDICNILKTNDKSILIHVYEKKMEEKQLRDSEIKALKAFIENDDASKVDELLDYQTIQSAIESLIPGEWSNYFKNHFRPFLQVKIKTEEQKQALNNLLKYCDETTIKTPLLMRVGMKFSSAINKNPKTAEEMIAYYRDMNEDTYEVLKKNVQSGVKIKNGILKYHPAFIAQKRWQKRLQDKGYNDIFIKNMKILSPKYGEYKDALDCINDRICNELGLYYDSNYNLVLKNRK